METIVIRTGAYSNEFLRVPATKVKALPEIDFQALGLNLYIHRPINRDGVTVDKTLWNVTDRNTGLKIAEATTRALALQVAAARIESHKDIIPGLIEKHKLAAYDL